MIRLNGQSKKTDNLKKFVGFCRLHKCIWWMMPVDDMMLLREYATRQSETAFVALVERYAPLVHSTALRRTDNAHLAQEVTQAVFIIFARKAAKLGQDTILPAWLYRTTRFVAENALTIQRRRREREQEAYMQTTLYSEQDSDAWQRLAPVLDNAMDSLSERDRTSLVLRYFENRSWRDVAEMMRVTEDAAQKRAARALEKLRKIFAKRGVALTVTIIASAVSANSVHAAPMAMVQAISGATVAKGATAATSTAMVKGTLKIMAWTKIKTAVVFGGVLLLGGSAVMVKESYFPTEPSYQQRKLSEWLVDINYGQPQEKRAKAGEAIRHMGKKTLPFLLATFSDPKPKGDLGQATWAFDALGPIANSAIPKLEKLQSRYPGYVPGALAGIRPAAVPVLLKSLTNESFFVRDNTAAAMANAIYSGKINGDLAKAALPIALSNLEYRNPTNRLFEINTRWRAAGLLDALHLNPDESVPALLKCMQESWDEERFTLVGECAVALGTFGKDARPALPNIMQYLDKTSEPTTNLNVQSCAVDCAMALARMGKEAQPAMPVLTKAAQSTNQAISLIANQALKNLRK